MYPLAGRLFPPIQEFFSEPNNPCLAAICNQLDFVGIIVAASASNLDDNGMGGPETPDNSPGNVTSSATATPAATPEIELTDLVREFADRLYGYAYRLCGDSATAEDLTQQTFMAAHRNLHQLREADKAQAWLFAILRRIYWKSRRKQRPVTAADLQLDPNQQATPVEVDEIDHEKLQSALGELPDAFRIVLVMFYFEDCSYQNIAEALELPLGTVMSRLARAKRQLRRRLQSLDAVRGE
jgi:RNA polymerase sigma-70 factor, ECF subfamily